MWRLVKWARQRSTTSESTTPPIQLTDQGRQRLSNTHAKKSKALKESFFPQPPNADLSDMVNFQYPNPLASPEITKEEIRRAILKAPPKKAPGTDNIPNHILHKVLL